MKLVNGFTERYNIHKLIYFEQYTDALTALRREKQLKGWSRKKKIELIKSINPTFQEVVV